MKRFVLLATLVLLAAGCSTRQMSSGMASSVGPQLSAERFLQAVNARDYVTMSRIFGTASGPVGDTGSSFGCFWKKLGTIFGGDSCVQWADIEVQMDLIARILQHQNYNIVSERSVSGRRVPAVRLGIDIVLGPNRTARDVGFVMINDGDQWLVEEIDLERVMEAED